MLPDTDDLTRELASNHTTERTSEQKTDHTPDPYIRLDKEKDKDQRKMMIISPP